MLVVVFASWIYYVCGYYFDKACIRREAVFQHGINSNNIGHIKLGSLILRPLMTNILMSAYIAWIVDRLHANAHVD